MTDIELIDFNELMLEEEIDKTFGRRNYLTYHLLVKDEKGEILRELEFCQPIQSGSPEEHRTKNELLTTIEALRKILNRLIDSRQYQTTSSANPNTQKFDFLIP